MTEAQARQILQDAGRDRRLSAQMFIDNRHAHCYKVKVELRRLRSIIVANYEDWPAVKAAWSDL